MDEKQRNIKTISNLTLEYISKKQNHNKCTSVLNTQFYHHLQQHLTFNNHQFLDNDYIDDIIKYMYDKIVASMAHIQLPQKETYEHTYEVLTSIFKYIEDSLELINIEDFTEAARKYHDSKEASLETLNNIIKKLNLNDHSIETIDSINYNLLKNTTNPQFNLDYFEPEDSDLKYALEHYLKNNSLYFKGDSKEETLYSVLYELDKMKLNLNIFIIKNKEAWDRFKTLRKPYCVLIPYFNNNLNWKDYYTAVLEASEKRNCARRGNWFDLNTWYEINKRSYTTIISRLTSLGMSKSEAKKYCEETNGLFFLMKKKSYQRYNQIADHINKINDKNALFTLLLIHQWTDSDNDHKLIEKLSNLSYKEFLLNVKDLIINNQCIYSIEDSWNIYNINEIPNDIWSRLLSNLKDIFLLDTMQFSIELKKNLLTSLLILKYSNLKINDRAQDIINEATDFISNLDTNGWQHIYNFADEFAELVPDVYFQSIKKEINKADGLFSTDNIQRYDNYLYKFFNSLLKFLFINKYKNEVLDIFWALNHRIKKGRYTDYLYFQLYGFYCPYRNDCPFTKEEKLASAKKAIETYEEAKEIILDTVMLRHTTCSYRLNKPIYLKISEPTLFTKDDILQVFDSYRNLIEK